MKKLLMSMILMVSAVMLWAEKTTGYFTLVNHQLCESCEKKIMGTLRFEKGVSKVNFSRERNEIYVIYNSDKTDRNKIIKAIKKSGFDAISVEAENSVSDKAD